MISVRNAHRQQNDCGLGSYDNSKKSNCFLLQYVNFLLNYKEAQQKWFQGFRIQRFLPDFTRDQNLLLRVKNSITAKFSQKLLKMRCNKNVCCTCTILRNYISLARTETSILPYYRTKIISFKACSF